MRVVFRSRLSRIVAIVAVAYVLPAIAAAQTARPHILVTNDDGVGSEGLAAIVAELKSFADVVVVAPGENNSGAAHSTIASRIAVEVQPLRRDGEIFGYGINATPADAAMFGILHFGAERPFDLVVSGINEGANTGNIAHYSGTVGAAMEGLYRGIPAVATSQDARQDYVLSARISAGIIRQVLQHGLPPGVMLSINIPRGELRGIRSAPMGGSYFGTSGFQETGRDGDLVSYQVTRRGPELGGDHTDTAAYLDGYVTITPLRFDWTDSEMVERLRDWDLRLDAVR